MCGEGDLMAATLLTFTPKPVVPDWVKQIGRCAFGIAYPDDTDADVAWCDLRDKGLYCRTHNPFGKKER